MSHKRLTAVSVVGLVASMILWMCAAIVGPDTLYMNSGLRQFLTESARVALGESFAQTREQTSGSTGVLTLVREWPRGERWAPSGRHLLVGLAHGRLLFTMLRVTPAMRYSEDGITKEQQTFYVGGQVSLSVPLLACVFALLPAYSVLSRFRPKPWPEGCCVACGYDLRGQIELRCPECGTSFERAESEPK